MDVAASAGDVPAGKKRVKSSVLRRHIQVAGRTGSVRLPLLERAVEDAVYAGVRLRFVAAILFAITIVVVDPNERDGLARF